MLLQTNSYIVPRDKRIEHSRILRRFRQTLTRLGCDHFEVYEQVGTNWANAEPTHRYVQIMRFRDRKHQLEVQAAERSDATAQAVIAEFCELINFPYQQQQGLFATGYYTSVLPIAPQREPVRDELEPTVPHVLEHEQEMEEGEPAEEQPIEEQPDQETLDAVEAEQPAGEEEELVDDAYRIPQETDVHTEEIDESGLEDAAQGSDTDQPQ